MNRWEKLEGAPFPQGVTWSETDRAFNFSIYSKHAEAVHLLLYSKADLVHPVLEYAFDYLKNKSGPIWHCRVSADEAQDAAYYAYRVDGPAPAAGYEWHNFDFEKILLDPSARSVFFQTSSAVKQPADQDRMRAKPRWACCRPWCANSTGRMIGSLDMILISSFTSYMFADSHAIQTPVFLHLIEEPFWA